MNRVDPLTVMAPLTNALIPVAATPQVGVCGLCRTGVAPDFTRCHSCHEAASLDPPGILPITLSVGGGLIHQHLWQYKNHDREEVRERTGTLLAALTAVFLNHHAECIGEWDYCTTVPSVRRIAMEPIVRRVQRLRDNYKPVLRARDGDGARVLNPEQFDVTDVEAGDRVLLLDDTFTTGAKMFSAVAAIRSRGGVVVGPVVIGRHIQRQWPPSRQLLEWLEQRTWSVDRCARCAGEVRSGTMFGK